MRIRQHKFLGHLLAIFGVILLLAVLAIFFDQAILVRQGTFYHGPRDEKIVALTFDDGPSPEWTPKILDELKKADVKATFFVVGKHVVEYPDIARRIVAEGHDIGNHTHRHHMLFFADGGTVKKELAECRKQIQAATGVSTDLFRPPKAWLTPSEKRKIQRWGYRIILWTLNSKDWVTFDDKYLVRFVVKNIQPGDIILFHDSGGAFVAEGGDRHETVLAIPQIIEKLRKQGYRFITITELLQLEENHAPKQNP